MSATGWTSRSRTLPDGFVERWLERDLGGGKREMRYLDGGSRMRYSAPAGTCRLVDPGEFAPRTSGRPLSGYRSTTTPAPLATREPEFTTEDVIREARRSHVSVRILESAYDGFFARQHTQYDFERIGDDCELGGGLFGGFQNDQFVVADITGRILADYAERSSGRLDLNFIEMKAETHRHKKTGHKLLGYWHSHPEIDGPDQGLLFACPSAADLRSLESLHARSPIRNGNAFRWPSLGLIVASRYADDPDAGWNRPLLTAFVARGHDEYPSVEFARVQIDGKPNQSASPPLGFSRA